MIFWFMRNLGPNLTSLMTFLWIWKLFAIKRQSWWLLLKQRMIFVGNTDKCGESQMKLDFGSSNKCNMKNDCWLIFERFSVWIQTIKRELMDKIRNISCCQLRIYSLIVGRIEKCQRTIMLDLSHWDQERTDQEWEWKEPIGDRCLWLIFHSWVFDLLMDHGKNERSKETAHELPLHKLNRLGFHSGQMRFISDHNQLVGDEIDLWEICYLIAFLRTNPTGSVCKCGRD